MQQVDLHIFSSTFFLFPLASQKQVSVCFIWIRGKNANSMQFHNNKQFKVNVPLWSSTLTLGQFFFVFFTPHTVILTCTGWHGTTRKIHGKISCYFHIFRLTPRFHANSTMLHAPIKCHESHNTSPQSTKCHASSTFPRARAKCCVLTLDFMLTLHCFMLTQEESMLSAENSWFSTRDHSDQSRFQGNLAIIHSISTLLHAYSRTIHYNSARLHVKCGGFC